jgi:hypothetical protein
MLPTIALDAWAAGIDLCTAEIDRSPTSRAPFSRAAQAYDVVTVADANIAQLRATSIARRPIATLKRSMPAARLRLKIQNCIIDAGMLRSAANEAPWHSNGDFHGRYYFKGGHTGH